MKASKKRSYLLLVACAALFLGASSLRAFDDGFSYDRKFEGKYVTVYCAPGLDLPRLAPQLNILPTDAILAGRPWKAGDPTDGELAPMLDTLFVQVSDILDMHLESFKTDIKICGTDKELAGIYKLLFGKDLEGHRAFYIYDLNTIYVAPDAFRQGAVGHEMSHAIISHYFDVSAPSRVQEVLSLYVEDSLKKKT